MSTTVVFTFFYKNQSQHDKCDQKANKAMQYIHRVVNKLYTQSEHNYHKQ